MRGHRYRWIVVCLAALVATPGRAVAECGPRPVNACQLINNDDDIFVARILAGLPDDPFTWRVRVIRSYRGTASGEILLRAFSAYDLPAPAHLDVGQSYLFYTSQEYDDGKMIRATPMACGTWLPLSAVSREEIAFLGKLNSRAADGRILGTLVRPLPDFKQEPVAGIGIQATDGTKTFTGTTDSQGRFDIPGLRAGRYLLKAALAAGLRIEGDTEVEVVAHGCYYGYLTTALNTTISGRLILPLGVQVTGTQITALRRNGRDVKSTFADPFGRYMISGLEPAEYVIGINASQYPPRVAAPFPVTYAPGTPDRAQATIIRLDGAADFKDVDITVSHLSDIVKISVKSTFEDGRPVPEQWLRLSLTGYGEHDSRTTTSADGVATVSVIRGVPVYLMGSTKGACLSPVRLGPDDYPERIDVTYTPDGCREMFNLTSLGVLQASAPGEATRVRVRVTFPDGTPAYKSNIGIVSVPGRGPYAQGFLTDKDGSLDLSVPVGSEFTLAAGAPDGIRNCSRPEMIVNTDRGIRWQPRVDRNMRPNWDVVPPSTGVVSFILEGPLCQP
jgi:hypothetical protein